MAENNPQNWTKTMFHVIQTQLACSQCSLLNHLPEKDPDRIPVISGAVQTSQQ